MKNNENEIDNQLIFLQKKRKLEKENIIKENKDTIHQLLSFLKYEENEINNDIELISIRPLSEYVKEKEDEWKKNKYDENFAVDKFAKSIEIISDFNYTLLKSKIENDIDDFIKYYKFYQFTLSVPQRKEIQKLINDKCDLPIIKNNFIIESIKETKDIFINLCNAIINIQNCAKNDFPEKLKNEFLKNGVYSEDKFNSFIPVVFSNNDDLKINKLIFEIIDFFFKSHMNEEITEKKEIELLKEKFLTFKLFKQIFDKFNLFKNNNEIFKIFDYLFNSFYVLFDVEKEKRKYDIFKNIILCCMPFELEKAKNFLTQLIDFINEDNIYIDNEKLTLNKIINLKAESIIYFKDKQIKVSCNEINWNLNLFDFLNLLDSDNFMLCFRYPKLSEMNYLYINKDIRENYEKLFEKIIKSKIMKYHMNIDKNAELFKYPFNNNSILAEIEKNCYLVPLPALNYYGLSDRNTFSIYLNSFINSSDFQKTFIDIDNIIKSKIHEIKHMYRVYMHIYKPDIQLKTPEINLKKLNTTDLTKNKSEHFKIKRKIIEYIYNSKGVFMKNSDDLDYGDILEISINGTKQNIFFLKNSLFCLSEQSWDLDVKEFDKKYFYTCIEGEFNLRRIKKNIFINCIIDYFKIKTNILNNNEADISKRSSKGKVAEDFDEENNFNQFYYIPRASHFRK